MKKIFIVLIIPLLFCIYSPQVFAVDNAAEKGAIDNATNRSNAAKKNEGAQKDLREGDSAIKATENFYSGDFKRKAAGDRPEDEKLFTKEGLTGYLLPQAAKWITGFLGAVAVIFLIWAGIQYLTAGGEEEKITQATKTTFYVLMGVILMMFAYAIVYLFLTILAPS